LENSGEKEQEEQQKKTKEKAELLRQIEELKNGNQDD